jgi:TonB family protein
MVIRVIAAAAALFGSPPLPETEYVIHPTGKWVVHFDDALCQAERDFGPPGKPLRLILKQPAAGNIMQVAVARKQSTADAHEDNGTITLDADAPQKSSFLIYSPPDQGFRLYSTNMPLSELRPSAETIWIRTAGLDQAFAIPGFSGLLQVMANCVADLRKSWNLGATGKLNLSQSARGNLKGLFSGDDYPTAAIMAAETGPVKVELLIDEEGKIADCSVIQTSGVAVLDAQTCAVLSQRAKFKPAVGKDGRATRSGFAQEIRWRIRM